MSPWLELQPFEVRWRTSAGQSHLAGVLVFEYRMIIEDAHAPEVRARAVAAIDRILSRVSCEDFRWFWTREGQRPSRIQGFLPEPAQAQKDAEAVGDAFNYLAIDCDNPYNDAPEHFLKVRLPGRSSHGTENMGSFHLRLPLSWARSVGKESVSALFAELSELLVPRFGSAGLALSAPVHAGGNQMRAAYEAYPFLSQHPGVDSGEAAYVAETISHFHDGSSAQVTTINWLTMVNSKLLALCGGFGNAKRQLGGPEITLRMLDCGIVICAGDDPQTGNVDLQIERLAGYVATARFLRPVRMLSSLSINPGFAPEGSNLHLNRYESAQVEYLRRFDCESESGGTQPL